MTNGKPKIDTEKKPVRLISGASKAKAKIMIAHRRVYLLFKNFLAANILLKSVSGCIERYPVPC